MIGLLKKWWAIKDDAVAKACLILAHGYGLTKDDKLPENAKRVLAKTLELARKFPAAKILFYNANCYWRPEQFEAQLKKDYLTALGAEADDPIWDKIIDNGVNSTINEVLIALNTDNLAGKTVISICERIHMRRIRLIWQRETRRYHPKVDFKIIGFEGIWTDDMPSFFCKSASRWLALNIIFSGAYAIFGNLMKNLSHKFFLKHDE